MKKKKQRLAYRFKDNKGNVLILSEDLTIADLVKMGMKRIRLREPDEPLPDNWYADTGETVNAPHHGKSA